MATLVRILFCLSVVGVLLYRYIDLQNQLTAIRIEIPLVAKDLRASLERNQTLKFELDRFASPGNLMDLWKDPRFSHLHFPTQTETLVLGGSPAKPLLQGHDATVAEVELLISEAPLSGG